MGFGPIAYSVHGGLSTDVCACSFPYSIHAVPVLLVPPEADREAHVQCPHVVPAPWGDVEGLPWPQGALQSLGLYKQREPGKIRALCIYLV